MTHKLPLILILALSSSLASACQAKKEVPATTVATADPSKGSANERNSGTVPTDAALATLEANFQKVLFDFDKSTLTEGSRSALKDNANILMKYSQVHVRIEGHTDDFGSEDYNLALGQQRAAAVHRFLLDMGVAKTKLTLISYGEEKALVGSGDKTAQAPNRRAEFVVTAGSDVATSSDAQPGVTMTLEVGS